MDTAATTANVPALALSFTAPCQFRLAGFFALWFVCGMPKQAGISAQGMGFEEALRIMLRTPPPPTSKKAKAKKPKRKK